MFSLLETDKMSFKVSGFNYTIRKAGAGEEGLELSYLVRVSTPL